MVSIRLVVVHRPTIALSQSNGPVLAVIASLIGSCSAPATEGGTVTRNASTNSVPTSVWPKPPTIAAAIMKKENTASSDI